jgi:hypothetical protein
VNTYSSEGRDENLKKTCLVDIRQAAVPSAAPLAPSVQASRAPSHAKSSATRQDGVIVP